MMHTLEPLVRYYHTASSPDEKLQGVANDPRVQKLVKLFALALGTAGAIAAGTVMVKALILIMYHNSLIHGVPPDYDFPGFVRDFMERHDLWDDQARREFKALPWYEQTRLLMNDINGGMKKLSVPKIPVPKN